MSNRWGYLGNGGASPALIVVQSVLIAMYIIIIVDSLLVCYYTSLHAAIIVRKVKRCIVLYKVCAENKRVCVDHLGS
jgi:hypothetical protein